MKIIVKNIRFIMAVLAVAAVYAGCTKGPNINTYSYPAPLPTGITPTSGYPGSYLTIDGSAFGDYKDVVKVSFNGILADTVISCEDGKIIVMVPSDAISGKVSLQVWDKKVDSIGSYTVWPPLTIKATDLLGGLEGDTLKIYGSGLGDDVSKIKIKFTGADATVASVSDSVITVTVPAGAADGTLSVSVNDSIMTGPQFKLLSQVGDPNYWLQFENNLADKMGGTSATYSFKDWGKAMGYDKGIKGLAAVLPGASNTLTTNNQVLALPAQITKSQELTVACWVYWTNDSAWVQEPVFDAGQARGARLCLMTQMNSSFGTGYKNLIGRLVFEKIGSYTTIQYYNAIGKAPLPKKEWHHVAFTISYANGYEKIYMDGVEQGTIDLPTTADPTIFNHNKVYIGAPTNGVTKEPAFGGMIDEFQVYNQALTPNQIFTLYFKSKP
jgi:hypothetical protein